MTAATEFDGVAPFRRRMESEGLPPVAIDTFAWYYRQLVSGENGLIPDRDIQPVLPGEVVDAGGIAAFEAAGRKVLDKVVVIVLNGGLGTSMGLSGPKSLLKVKDDRSFLDILLAQADRSGARIAFMNSFSTHEETLAAVRAAAPAREPLYFLQHRFPKILRETLAPALWPNNPKLEWNPPGHGDIYTALHSSGMLDRLLDEGITYAFISNSDNLGATLDASLLGYFAHHRFPLMMEVAERTPADRKGGHLARHRNGRLLLREIAQCPEDEIEAFQDISRYRFFNTNNLWANLEYLKALIASQRIVRLPLILNPKHLDPRNPCSPPVYQVETAMGAAISLFEEATAVRIPESRFFPVKKCNDLLAVRSDCFLLRDGRRLVANPRRTLGRIEIDLDPRYYGHVDGFEKRFAGGVPSLVDCEALKIEGDVFFEDGVVVTGRAVIRNTAPAPAVVRRGTVVSGDLEPGPLA